MQAHCGATEFFQFGRKAGHPYVRVPLRSRLPSLSTHTHTPQTKTPLTNHHHHHTTHHPPTHTPSHPHTHIDSHAHSHILTHSHTHSHTTNCTHKPTNITQSCAQPCTRTRTFLGDRAPTNCDQAGKRDLSINCVPVDGRGGVFC